MMPVFSTASRVVWIKKNQHTKTYCEKQNVCMQYQVLQKNHTKHVDEHSCWIVERVSIFSIFSFLCMIENNKALHFWPLVWKADPTAFHKGYLTLNVRGPSYLGLTRSISWLLMPWLLPSPGHQQPWYWLCRICRSWSYLRKDFKYLCQINVE